MASLEFGRLQCPNHRLAIFLVLSCFLWQGHGAVKRSSSDIQDNGLQSAFRSDCSVPIRAPRRNHKEENSMLLLLRQQFTRAPVQISTFLPSSHSFSNCELVCSRSWSRDGSNTHKQGSHRYPFGISDTFTTVWKVSKHDYTVASATLVSSLSLNTRSIIINASCCIHLGS